MACRLIINADDFGWSPGVNDAVCDLYDAGILTSASLMVAAPAAGDAAQRMRARPELGVGLHVVLVRGPAVLSSKEIPSLVDARGWFTRDFVTAGFRCTLLPRCRRDLAQEIQAQFRGFGRLVAPPDGGMQAHAWSHVDSHLHFSLTPVVFDALLLACRGYPIVGFRVPEDDYQLYRRMDPRDAARQRLLAVEFSLLCRRQRRALHRLPYVTPDRCYGLFRTGRLSPEYLAELVRRMPEGDFELHCHPDLSTEAGRREHAALRSDLFREALREREVELVSYPTLAARRGEGGNGSGGRSGR